jgi:uncharacterized protein (DUF427 family)
MDVRAEWNGTVVAESEATQELGGYVYFPREAVRMELLRAAPQTPHDLECPHGVRFFDVVEGDREAPRAAWTYETPKPSHEAIDHWIGFWKDVRVEP